jgi:hypothetical protein
MRNEMMFLICIVVRDCSIDASDMRLVPKWVRSDNNAVALSIPSPHVTFSHQPRKKKIYLILVFLKAVSPRA